LGADELRFASGLAQRIVGYLGGRVASSPGPEIR
jgi:hypothetical protein